MRLFIAFCFLGMFFSSLKAESHSFFPTTRFIVTPVTVYNNMGASLLGELGCRNFRFNGDWGGFVEDCYRFKVGGEYLAQKLKYDFHKDHEREWIHQLGVGGKFQFFYCRWKCIRGFQLSGSYSHSFGKSLHSSDYFKRHIAGAWSYDVEGGIMTTPNVFTSVLYSIGFAEVNYARKFHGRKSVAGLAFSLDYNQAISECIGLNIKAQYTRAYNYLEALLSWTHPMWYGDLSLGIFAANTWGKYHLPSSTVTGLEVRFNFGVSHCKIVTRDCCFNGEIDSCDCDRTGVAGWLGDPAVYIPQVFAIREKKKS